MNAGVFLTFSVYFFFMFGIGIYFYKKANDLGDYILGGRSLNGWVTALSAQASDMSGWLLLGLPGAAYVSGLSAGWIAIGLLVGTYINWKFIAKRLRVYTEYAGDAITIIIIVPVVGIIQIGGWGATTAAISEINPNLLNMFTDGTGSGLALIGVISSLAWGLGYFGQPHILVRFMGIRHADEVKKARVIAMVWVTLSLAAAVLVGVVGTVLMPGVENAETIFMSLVYLTFHPAVAGILLAAILAAVMSTADSQLLVTASAISEDFYKVLLRKNASDKELLWVSRGTVIVVAFIAYLIARNPDNSVMGLVSYAWAGFGATFGLVILLSLYWKKINRWGALAGMAIGGLTTIIFKALNTGLYEIVPGIIAAFLAAIVVTTFTGGSDQQIQDEFNEVQRKF